MAQLMDKLNHWEPVMMIVAEETHEDGSPHLHAAVKLKKKCNIANASALDLCEAPPSVVTHHGDYRARRNWKTAVQYVTKEDKNPATFGIPDLPSFLAAMKKKKSTSLALVGSQILDGTYKDTAGIFADHPYLLISSKRKVEEALAWVKERKRLRPTIPWTQFTLNESWSEGLRATASWCNLNLGVQDREFKKKQLWIVSPPDFGKTTFVNWLSERFFTYMVPIDDAWDDLYTDEYGLAVIDEFKGQRRVSWLNGFVQGGMFPVKRRGTATYVKTKNMPVIVLSNFSPQDAYVNCPMVAWQSLMARFEVVTLSQHYDDTPCKLFNLID